MDKPQGQQFPGQMLAQRGPDVLVTGHLAGHSTTVSMDYKYSREERTLPLTRSGECGRGKDPRATHRVFSYMTRGLQCTLHHSREGVGLWAGGYTWGGQRREQ